MKLAPALAATLALGAAACGPGRTSAATQPTPAAFDQAQSDAAAVELVDASLEALGGHATWDAVKELRFEAKYFFESQLQSWARHAWDRWNGRHNYQSADLATDDGRPDSLKWMIVFYDLFDAEVPPHASYGGREVAREDAERFRNDARKRLASDAYMLTMVHKLRDPGVKLTLDGEVKDVDGVCAAGCKTVKVTFDPAVGEDVWFVNYDNATKLPEIIEKQAGAGRIGFQILAWTEVGGLKFPTKLQNMGLDGEVFEFAEIKIGAPDDQLYIPQVTGD